MKQMRVVRKLLSIPSQAYLLSGIMLFVFILPLIDKYTILDFIAPLSYSIMTLSIVSVIERKKQQKMKFLFLLIGVSVVLIWVMYFMPNEIISFVSFFFSISIFITATIILINQIVKSKEVTPKVIIETISSYLLLGVMFTLTNSLIYAVDHQSINLSNGDIADLIYYSFITLTTIGYGDISPVSDFARMVSIFFGLLGQLYLTIIMAFIIGKYLNKKQD